MTRTHTLTFITLALALFVALGCGPAEIDPVDGPPDGVDPALVPPADLSQAVNPSGSFGTYSNGSMPACGTVMASFGATKAYSNGKNTGTGYSCAGAGSYGLQYQCVELVQRHFKTNWGLRWWGNAKDLLNNAPKASVDVYYNGDAAHPPVPGDMIVWTSGTYGHVALVTAVSSSGVSIIEQNVTGSGSAVLPYDGKSVGARWGSWVPAGWAHAKANTAGGTNPGPGPGPNPTPPPTPPPAPTDPLVQKCQTYGWISTCQGTGSLLACDKAAGTATVVTCQHGCKLNALGTPDACNQPSTPPPPAPTDPAVKKCQGHGWISTCQDAKVLVQCHKASGTAKVVTCQHGCQRSAFGTPDACKQGSANPPPPPPQNPPPAPNPGPVSWDCNKSAWAGQQWWTCSGSARYRCVGGQAVKEDCAAGCWVNKTGAHDHCIQRTTGWSCGKSAWGGAQLWTCSGNQMYKCDASGPLMVSCQSGCQSNPTGTNDRCR